MRPAVKPAGPSSGLGTLLIACAATLFVASRLWTSSREVHHLREELAAVHTSATSAALQQQPQQPQQQQQQQQLQPTPAAGAGATIDAGNGLRLASGAAEEQPLLFYSVRAQPPPGQETPPLDGPPLDADPLPLSSDPDGKLLGQVNLVEAGRVHGWACVKGSQAAALTVTVYVDGVQVGASQAVLPTQTSHVRQLCQLDPPGGAAAAAEEALQEAALHVGRGGVGFVVPLPPLAEGLHVLRVFVAAPAAAFRQELNQSPLLFRESSISPDQEERIRRKDAIIQTRNAQVAALWDELHTKLPWRNAVAGRKPIQPFPAEQEEEDRRQAAKQGNQTDLVLFIAVNTGLTSRKRRDILRKTWVPSGRLDEVEARLGVRIRFFLGYSQQKGDSVEKELQAEMREFGDMERLDIQDEYSELSRKTARLFSQMSSSVRADFYFKIDDDVAVNVEALAAYLRERRQLGNLYLGCMKSGEVLTDKRWKWYEPEHWRFGDPVGKDDKVNYMRHASGQIYGMSRPVARYIAQNEAILHRFANEDVSVGAWLMGLDIVYDNNRRLCCDTEWKCTQQSGSENVCLAFSENQCAGLCRSEERLEGIYKDCVLDAYQAGKKGKLPWWGQSGWATAGRNAGGAQADKVEEAKNVTQKAGDKAAAGAATTTAAGTAAGTTAGTTAGAAAGTAAGTAGAAANAAAGTAAGVVTNTTAGMGAAGAAGAGTGS